jgi:hypothetical protein
MSTMLRIITVCFVAGTTLPAMAQVPVNDGERTKTETETRTCMERARTYKQRAEAPTKGVHASVANPGGTSTAGGTSAASGAGSLAQAGGGNVMGGALSGTSIGGVDLSGIMAIAGGVAALKSNNAGQAVNAMSAVSAAIAANKHSLVTQSQAIGSVNSIQGAFDQNSSGRLSEASVWGQAMQSGATTLQLRNQQLLDQTAAASATSNIMDYDKSNARLVDDDKVKSDNTESGATDTTNLDAIQQELARLQAEAAAKALANSPQTNPAPAN